MRNLELAGCSIFLRFKLTDSKCRDCFFNSHDGCFTVECRAEEDLDDQSEDGTLNYKVLIRCNHQNLQK